MQIWVAWNPVFNAVLTLGLLPANERRRYKVTRLSLAGQNPRISPVKYCLSQHCCLHVGNIICHHSINTYLLITTEANVICHYSDNVSLTICVIAVITLSCVRVDKFQSSILRTHRCGTWFKIRLGLVFPGAYYKLFDSTKYFMPSNHGDHLHKMIVCPYTFWFCTLMSMEAEQIHDDVTGSLCGEFTGQGWILRTKASDVERWCFLWSAPEQTG